MTSKEAIDYSIDNIEILAFFEGGQWRDDKDELIETLQKIEKNLEVLEILKRKKVHIDELKNCIKYDSEDRPALELYNDFASYKNSLTQEEYDLLKEWMENE